MHLCDDAIASTVHALILRSKSLPQIRQSHAFAAVSGVLRHHRLSVAALLLSYAAHGVVSDAQSLFHHSPLKLHSAVLWNALVRALSSASLDDDAFRTYNAMIRSGVRPDDRTFPFALAAAASAVASPKGRELHGSAVRSGFVADVFVGNTLLAFYGVVGDVASARQVFDEMCHRDVVSWNSVISVLSDNGGHAEAVVKFLELKRSGIAVNSVSLISAVPSCAAIRDLVLGRGLHCFALKAGLDSVVRVINALIDMYGKCGDSESCLRVFRGMPEKNDVSWNSVLGGLVNVGQLEDAVKMFKIMVSDGVKPNSITISTFLSAVVELENFYMGKQVHAYALRNCMHLDIFVANSLIDMYAKYGFLENGSNVFYGMEKQNVVSWNAMIANFTQNGAELEAIMLVREMQEHGESPNSITFTSVLPACARIASLRKGKEIHARSIRMRLNGDVFVSNALIDMYAKCAECKLAQNVFNASERDQVSYNSLIIGYSETPWCFEALLLFVEMRSRGLEHDTISLKGALSACGNLSALKQGREIHSMSVKTLFGTHLLVANSLLDMYIKCGRINIAKKIFDKMQDKDVASWNSMILGYGMQGELETAINMFDMMQYEAVEYDHVSYIAVLSACSHSGLVERGKRYFDQMIVHNIKPMQMHYACMVDILGRAGFLSDAAALIRDMPFDADSNVWGALLGACRIHGDLELGRWAAEHLFELKPEHSGYYVLLANMYAEADRWDEANEIRTLMKSKKVVKNPGCTWVGGGYKLHTYIVGERIEDLEEVM